MNALNHSYSWVLSLTIHLMAAAILGWFVGRNLTRPTPDTLTFAAVDITLADTAVAAAAGRTWPRAAATLHQAYQPH